MKTKKLTKKIENIILEKKIKNFHFFTLEYCSDAKLFFKKNIKNNLINDKNIYLKHPLKLNKFTTFKDLEHYLTGINHNVVYIYINKIYIKQKLIKNIYNNNNLNLTKLFIYFKKLYVIWYLV